ncbi:uncharacterized protein LOC109720368 [Ananas comosus]|uniref:Uncharacterized protein LOC109720368 n=1 Tax=Ananas comosus TaxID=4615 RepID=A0A6P5G577_ANACO|nr:uncharacterized protein LOC109720368 [Ananas comosus]
MHSDCCNAGYLACSEYNLFFPGSETLKLYTVFEEVLQRGYRITKSHQTLGGNGASRLFRIVADSGYITIGSVYDIEEKHSLSGELSLTLPTEPGKERRPLESVLEEVPVKGSLVERVASLEHRVVKLSVQLEEERLRLKPAILPTPEDCTCNSTAKKKENGLKSISEEDHQEMNEEKAIEDECLRSSSGCRASWRRIHHPILLVLQSLYRGTAYGITFGHEITSERCLRKF